MFALGCAAVFFDMHFLSSSGSWVEPGEVSSGAPWLLARECADVFFADMRFLLGANGTNLDGTVFVPLSER